MTTEQRAAEALLDKGTKVPVTAPLLFRAFGKQFVYPVVRPSFMGTLYLIDRELEKAGVTEELLDSLVDAPLGTYKKFAKPVSKAIAYGILNSWLLMPLAPLVAWYLRWGLTNIRAIYATKILLKLSRPQDFTNTIRSLSRMKMTAPNLSQEAQGS